MFLPLPNPDNFPRQKRKFLLIHVDEPWLCSNFGNFTTGTNTTPPWPPQLVGCSWFSPSPLTHRSLGGSIHFVLPKNRFLPFVCCSNMSYDELSVSARPLHVFLDFRPYYRGQSNTCEKSLPLVGFIHQKIRYLEAYANDLSFHHRPQREHIK